MHLKKFLLFGLMAAVLPAVAEEAADRKTATSLKYVEHELDTRQNKFGADTNKAMEYTSSAGTVQKRTVKSDLGSDTSDTSLPMVGGVNTKLNQKQDDIAAVNDHTAVTYTGQPGGIGQKGIYQTTESYAAQSDNLIDAKTFNAALKNGLDSEFVCREDNLDPVSGLCWLYTIHNNEPENLFNGIMYQGGISQAIAYISPGFSTVVSPYTPVRWHGVSFYARVKPNTRYVLSGVPGVARWAAYYANENDITNISLSLNHVSVTRPSGEFVTATDTNYVVVSFVNGDGGTSPISWSNVELYEKTSPTVYIPQNQN